MKCKWTILVVPMTMWLVPFGLVGPLPQLLGGDNDERTKLGTAGGNGGQAFQDNHLPKKVHVIGVKIRHGDFIDAVDLLYKSAGKVEGLGRHGGDGGSEDVFLLDKGEHITGITGTANDDFVITMTIVTNKRKSRKFGGANGDGATKYSFVVEPGLEVVGFYGRAGQYLDQIGIFARKR